MRRALFIMMFATLSALAPLARAAEPDISVKVQIEKTAVSVGEPFQYQISIEGTTEEPEIQLPDLQGVQVDGGQPFRQSQSSVSIINGRRTEQSSVSIIYTWNLTPTKPGPLVIPRFAVNVGGKSYSTEEVRVQVSPAEKSDAILLRASIDATTAYVGQLIKLKVTFFTSRSTADLPIFDMPGVDGPFDIYNTDEANVLPGQVALSLLGSQSIVRETRTNVGGTEYSAFTLERTIAPRKAGTYTIGPANVVVAIVERSSRNPWEQPRYRRVTASSDPITLEVRELPKEGMPADFSGLVGSYEIDASASPSTVNVGDPITLTVTVRGPEPLDRIPDPVTDATPGFAGAFRIIPDNLQPRRSTERLVYTRTIRTVNEKAVEIPAITLNFFDPSANAYRTARTSPIPLTVRPTRTVTASDAIGNGNTVTASGESIESRVGGLAANRVGPAALIDASFDITRAIRSPVVIAAAASPPVAYALALVIVAARKRDHTTPAKRRQRAMPQALATLRSTDLDPAGRASGAIRGYLADLLGHNAGHVLTPDEAHALVAPRSVELADRTRDFLSRCDAARFAPSAGDAASLAGEAERLLNELASGVRP